MKTFRFFLASWLIIIASCSNPTKEFKKVSSINTIEAFENFITKHPNDSLVVDAKFQICNLKNSIFEYEIFNNDYPTNKYIEQSNASIKKLLGTINGRFIEQNTNEPINNEPILFFIYDENITDKRKELIDKLLKKTDIDANIENNGNFNIKNVIPGRYALMIYTRSGYKNTGKIFNIEANEILDLGDVPVNVKK